MDFDRMYDEALTQQKKAIGLISLIILIIAALFLFAAFVVSEPLMGIPVAKLKNILVISAVVIMFGGFLPKMFFKKQTISY